MTLKPLWRLALRRIRYAVAILLVVGCGPVAMRDEKLVTEMREGHLWRRYWSNRDGYHWMHAKDACPGCKVPK